MTQPVLESLQDVNITVELFIKSQSVFQFVTVVEPYLSERRMRLIIFWLKWTNAMADFTLKLHHGAESWHEVL